MQIDLSGMPCEFTFFSAELTESFSTELTSNVTPDELKRLLNKWYVLHLLRLGAKANSKVAYLAYHAKTRRARIKNRRRLFKIGCLIEIRGD